MFYESSPANETAGSRFKNLGNQLSRDGERNGLFTQTLKEVWSDGSFSGPYPAFRNEIVDRMPSDQTPNFFRVG
jgi:metacaspase-1